VEAQTGHPAPHRCPGQRPHGLLPTRSRTGQLALAGPPRPRHPVHVNPTAVPDSAQLAVLTRARLGGLQRSAAEPAYARCVSYPALPTRRGVLDHAGTLAPTAARTGLPGRETPAGGAHRPVPPGQIRPTHPRRTGTLPHSGSPAPTTGHPGTVDLAHRGRAAEASLKRCRRGFQDRSRPWMTNPPHRQRQGPE
jgi:hypothetical protein